jgi:hypothetical protein
VRTVTHRGTGGRAGGRFPVGDSEYSDTQRYRRAGGQAGRRQAGWLAGRQEGGSFL